MGKIALLFFLAASVALGYFERRPLYQRQTLVGGKILYDINQIRPCIFENGYPIDIKLEWNTPHPDPNADYIAIAKNEARAISLLQYVEQFEEQIAVNMQYIKSGHAGPRPPPNTLRTVTWISLAGQPERVIALLSINFRPTFIHELLKEHNQPPLPNLPTASREFADLSFENPGPTGIRYFSREMGRWWDKKKVGRKWISGPSVEVGSYYLDSENIDDFSLLLNQLTIPEARFSLEEIPGGPKTGSLDPEEVAMTMESYDGEAVARHEYAPSVVPFQRVTNIIAWTVLPALERSYINTYKFKKWANFTDDRFKVVRPDGKVIRDGKVSVLKTDSESYEFATWQSIAEHREKAKQLVKAGHIFPTDAGELDGRYFGVRFRPIDRVFAERYLDTIRPDVRELSKMGHIKKCNRDLRWLGGGDIQRGIEVWFSITE